jgi:hypothetical protein
VVSIASGAILEIELNGLSHLPGFKVVYGSYLPLSFVYYYLVLDSPHYCTRCLFELILFQNDLQGCTIAHFPVKSTVGKAVL